MVRIGRSLNWKEEVDIVLYQAFTTMLLPTQPWECQLHVERRARKASATIASRIIKEQPHRQWFPGNQARVFH